MRRHLTFKNSVIAFAGIVYAVVFAEYFLRVMDPQPLMPRYVTGAPWGTRVNIPSATYRQHTPEVDVSISVNSQGMRADRDFALVKPRGVCRIALLGDSYFMGYEADLEDTIAGRLNARLADAGYSVEILNFAVSGFSTSEMIIQFDEQVEQFRPDITFFQFHASDFGENVRAGLHTVEVDGSISRTGAQYLPGIKARDFLMQFASYRWLIENSHFYSAIREKAAIWVKNLLFQLAFIKQADAAVTATADPHAYTGLLLRAARRDVSAAGSAWYAVDIPTWSSRTEFHSFVDRLKLDPRTRARMITTIEGLNEAANEDTKLFFEQGHRHLTPLGNDIVARLMAERVLAENASLFDTCRK